MYDMYHVIVLQQKNRRISVSVALNFLWVKLASVSYRKSVGNAVCTCPRSSKILIFFPTFHLPPYTTTTYIMFTTARGYTSTTRLLLKVKTGLYYNIILHIILYER